MRIAHIVNPLAAGPESDLRTAQPITFETMRIARDFAAGRADVTLLAIQLEGEEAPPLPAAFTRLPPLTRTVADLHTFARPRPLPLIRDILDTLFTGTTDADHLVYSNVDISLQPHFYLTVQRLIEQGHDAFAINRRTIPGHYRDLADIPRMWAEIGEPHPGWDCFVFPRGLYPRFQLGRVCIGAGWFGRTLIANLSLLALNFRVFTDLHLTFHIGNERAWKCAESAEYTAHNREECRRILEQFDRRNGPLDRSRLPGRFLSLLTREEGKAIR